MPSNHLILSSISEHRPLLLPPSIFPSIGVFSNEPALHIRWPKYWSFSFSISPSNDYTGLISFRMDWLDLLAVQGTLKSLLQHHSSKASILWCSAFFMVQLSYPYMTTGKIIVLTRQNFVGNIQFSSVAQLCLTLCNPMDCSPPGSSIHGIFQARVLEWGAITFSVTNLDSILKSRDITLPTKVHLVKAMVFPVVIYGCESWTIKKVEHRRIDAFEL